MTQFIKEVYSKCTYQNILLVETIFLILIKPSSPGIQMINSLLNLMRWVSHRTTFKTIKVQIHLHKRYIKPSNTSSYHYVYFIVYKINISFRSKMLHPNNYKQGYLYFTRLHFIVYLSYIKIFQIFQGNFFILKNKAID